MVRFTDMKKLQLLLSVLFLIYWGCEDILDSYDEHFGSTVNLWGEEYSIKNTIELDLSNTGLTGSIPSKIGDLKNLEKLSLRSNQLSGEIPSEIGFLTNLTSLYLNNNQLTGEIPSQIGLLTNLTSLYLNNNQLTGEIPFELGNLIDLRYLKLNDNQLTGEISENFCILNIKWYTTTTYGISYSVSSIQNNQFCPPYPNCISIYTGQQDISNCWDCEQDSVVELWDKCYSKEYTTRLYLSNSGLSGSIPTEIGDLTNLERLYLHENQLTGEIPSEIGDLINLNYLNLSYNSLTGLIPPEIGNLTSIYQLDLSFNSLTGSIPPEVGNLTNIYQLNLNNNQLSGLIPNEICSLDVTWYKTSFTDFTPTSSVSYNQLCSPYPSCLYGNYYINGLGPNPIVGNQNTINCD